MSNKAKIYIGISLFTVLGIVILKVNKKEKINWFPSYATHHKIPFGSLVFKKQIQHIADSVIIVNRPPFEFLKNNNIHGTYLFYNGTINFGETELNTLLNWTAAGNTLILSALNFKKNLLDTLNLETLSMGMNENYNTKLSLVNPIFKNESYLYDRRETLYQFSKIDSVKSKVISVVTKNMVTDSIDKTYISAIKQIFGKGEIILNLFPQAYTNYFILQSPNQNFTAGLLSYIDTKNPIYIDTHYKSGKKIYTSPIYLLLNTKELKWAYYMVLIGSIIYIIFEGKRKQRPIPTIKPLTNKTLDFTLTISDMYYQKRKHKELSQLMIQHFIEYIRAYLYLDTSKIDSKFINNLSSKSNNTIEYTQSLFDFINKLNMRSTVSKKELGKLNSLIEKFKSNTQWKTYR